MRITERRKSGALLGALTTTLLVAGSLIAAPTIASAEPPDAEDGTVAGATLDWGVRESFRRYVVGPIPKGKIDLLGTTTGEYHWSGGQGTAALDGSAASVSFGEGNGVHFRGHQKGSDAEDPYILDIAFTNPRVVVLSPTAAEIRVDVEGREYVDTTTLGETYSLTDALLAEVTLPEPTVAGDVMTWTDASTVLAEEGVAAFGGFYPAGEPLDSATFSLPITPRIVAKATQTSLTSSTAVGAEGDPVTLTATVTPEAAGAVQFKVDGVEFEAPVAVAAGTATLTTSALNLGASSVTAAFVPEDNSAFLGSVSAAVEITVVARPTVTVDKADGLNPAGETVTVRGSGFLPNAPYTTGRYAPLEGKFAGTYVVFGSFAEQWKPSQGIGSAARKTLASRWAVQAAELELIASVPGGTKLNADGTFETTLTLTKDSAEALANGRYGVYTYAAGGATYAPFETFTPIAFAPAAGTNATLEASATSTFVGDSVELSTSVTPDVPGAVQFKSGDVSLGGPIEVVEGAATLETTELAVGLNRVTAEFVPANTDTHALSVSTEVVITVAALPVALINGKPAGTVTVNPGDEVQMKIGAFNAGEKFGLELLSEVEALFGVYDTDPDGFVNITWAIPADAVLGAHEIILTNMDTGRKFEFPDAFIVEKAATNGGGGGGGGTGDGGGGTGGGGTGDGGGGSGTGGNGDGGKGSGSALEKTGAEDGVALSLAAAGGMLLLLGGALVAARRGLGSRRHITGITE